LCPGADGGGPPHLGRGTGDDVHLVQSGRLWGRHPRPACELSGADDPRAVVAPHGLAGRGSRRSGRSGRGDRDGNARHVANGLVFREVYGRRVWPTSADRRRVMGAARHLGRWGACTRRMTDHMTNHHRSMTNHTTRRTTSANSTEGTEGDVQMAATTAW